jgi:hypothetical protein
MPFNSQNFALANGAKNIVIKKSFSASIKGMTPLLGKINV